MAFETSKGNNTQAGKFVNGNSIAELATDTKTGSFINSTSEVTILDSTSAIEVDGISRFTMKDKTLLGFNTKLDNSENYILSGFGKEVESGQEAQFTFYAPAGYDSGWGAYQVPMMLMGEAYGYLELNSPTNAGIIIYNSDDGNGGLVCSSNTGDLRFVTTNGRGQMVITNAKDGVEGLTIEQGTNKVGINTVTPNGTLHVMDATSEVLICDGINAFNATEGSNNVRLLNTAQGELFNGTLGSNTVIFGSSVLGQFLSPGYGAELINGSMAAHFFDGSGHVVDISNGTAALNITGDVSISASSFIQGSGVDSINPTTRILYGSDGTSPMIDWKNNAGQGVIINGGIYKKTYTSYNGIFLNGSSNDADYNILSSVGDQNLYLNRPNGASMAFRMNNSTQLNIDQYGHLSIPSDTSRMYFGAGSDSSIHYNGTSMFIITDVVSASDLHIDCGTDKTIVLDETVWADIDFPILIRTTGTGIPTLTAINGNITMPEWAVNDYNVCESEEFIHEWKEGSPCYWHIHLTTNGSDVDDRYVRFELEYGYNDGNGTTWTFPSTVDSGDLLIPAGTADKTMLILSIGNFTPTNAKIAGHIVARLKRIASSGTAPTNNPWIPMLQMHIEKDTMGSRQMTSK
jgi:hypothetical protein